MSWWPFRRKYTLEDSGILQGMTDCHSHLLPGVDDGVRTCEEAIEILHIYEQFGIREVWFTPHVMEDIPNTTAGLTSCFEKFCNSYTGNVRLHLAAEYMLDNLFKERLANNDLLPLGDDGNYLLVETSYFNPPVDLYNILEKIKTAGYYPLLAHPERYVYMGENDYQRLRKMNVCLQLNIPSLYGQYGKEVQNKAFNLLQSGMYDKSGMDIHNIRVLNHLLKNKLYLNNATRISCKKIIA